MKQSHLPTFAHPVPAARNLPRAAHDVGLGVAAVAAVEESWANVPLAVRGFEIGAAGAYASENVTDASVGAVEILFRAFDCLFHERHHVTLAILCRITGQ